MESLSVAPSLEHRFSQRNRWFTSRPGQAQLEAEALYFGRHLQRIAGFAAVMVGPGDPLFAAVDPGRLTHIVHLRQVSLERLDGDLQAWVDCLPLCSERFDVLLLAHVLDWQDDPLPVLREWVRLLKPGGRLLLTMNRCGIGPWYPWPGPPTPRGYLPWFTRRRLQSLALEAISREWLLPAQTANRWSMLAPMRAPVVGLHLRKTRAQVGTQAFGRPAQVVLPLS